jgi:hypothetical protein
MRRDGNPVLTKDPLDLSAIATVIECYVGSDYAGHKV